MAENISFNTESLGAPVDTLSYEQARAELENVVRQLESGASDLETSIALWERGESLAKRCEAWLEGAREKLNEARAEQRQRITQPARRARAGLFVAVALPARAKDGGVVGKRSIEFGNGGGVRAFLRGKDDAGAVCTAERVGDVAGNIKPYPGKRWRQTAKIGAGKASKRRAAGR